MSSLILYARATSVDNIDDENTRYIYDRREARGLDDIFLAKQQHEKDTQDLEGEMEAVHRRVSEPAFEVLLYAHHFLTVEIQRKAPTR